jgi:hypothetical protein
MVYSVSTERYQKQALSMLLVSTTAAKKETLMETPPLHKIRDISKKLKHPCFGSIDRKHTFRQVKLEGGLAILFERISMYKKAGTFFLRAEFK